MARALRNLASAAKSLIQISDAATMQGVSRSVFLGMPMRPRAPCAAVQKQQLEGSTGEAELAGLQGRLGARGAAFGVQAGRAAVDAKSTCQLDQVSQRRAVHGGEAFLGRQPLVDKEDFH